MVVPFDFALDEECWRWMPEGYNLHIARTAYNEHTTVDEAHAQNVSDASVVVPAVRELLMARPASIAYSCTMGSFINGNAGEHLLCAAMSAAGAQKPVTTSGALLEALHAMGIKKLAIATPYNESITRRLTTFLEAAGHKVTKAGYLGSDGDIMLIGPDTVREMAHSINTDDAEALFFSCTDLRMFDVIAELEKELGKPILSANQVTMWATLKVAGLPLPDVNQRLFQI